MRKLIIEVRDSGQVVISNSSGQQVHGSSIERAISRVFAGDKIEPPDVTLLHAAEVIDNLLGPEVQGRSQIHEGVLGT